MRGAIRQMVELAPGGQNDRDGEHAASVLAAYFNAEQTRAVRRVLWRWLPIAGAVVLVVEATTRLLSNRDVYVSLTVMAAAAVAAVAFEWRAENRLRGLIASAGVRTVRRDCSER